MRHRTVQRRREDVCRQVWDQAHERGDRLVWWPLRRRVERRVRVGDWHKIWKRLRGYAGVQVWARLEDSI